MRNDSFTLPSPSNHAARRDSHERPRVPPVQILLRPFRLLFVALVVLAVSSAPALAATCPKAPPAPKSDDCAKAIVGDWYSDGDLDYIYSLDCYTKAIQSLGADLRGYSNAPDDILRARRFARRGCGDPGRASVVSTDTTATDTSSTDSVPTDTTTGTTGSSGDSSSVPVPLIVLGGLAVLLVAAGGAGYLSRRRRASEGPGDDPPRKQLPR